MGPVPGRSRAISIHDHGGIQYDDLSAEEDRVIRNQILVRLPHFLLEPNDQFKNTKNVDNLTAAHIFFDS